MSQSIKTAVGISFAIVTGLLVLLSVGTMLGFAMSSGVMMHNTVISGLNWVWVPGLLMFFLGALFIWINFEQKN